MLRRPKHRGVPSPASPRAAGAAERARPLTLIPLLLLALPCVVPAAGGSASEGGAPEIRRDGGTLIVSTLEGVEVAPFFELRYGGDPPPDGGPPGDRDRSRGRLGIRGEDWIRIDVCEFPKTSWPGQGWFRFHLTVAAERHGEPIGLLVAQEGAAEVFLDGRRVHYFGRVGRDSTAEVPDRTQDPRPIYFPRLDETEAGLQPDAGSGAGSPGRAATNHVLTVRYSSHLLDSPRFAGVEPDLRVELGALRPMVERRVDLVRKLSLHQMLLVGLSLAFAVTHLMLFLYRPRAGPNFYFALMALTTAGTILFNFQAFISADPRVQAGIQSAFLVCFAAAALSALRFAYSLLDVVVPRTFQVFFALAAPLALWAPLQPFLAQPWVFSFVLLANLEIVRRILSALIRRHRPAIGGARIIGWGAVPLAVTTPYQILEFYDLVPSLWRFIDFPSPYYCLVFLMLSMSIYLARDFARTQDRLERQLVRVQQLSMEAIGQEQSANRDELEQVRLAAELARRDAELAEARELQRSLLPTSLPTTPHLDFGVHFEASDPVGGDFYDCRRLPNGDILVVLGNAPGHGITASTMVAATKGILLGLDAHGGPAQWLAGISRALSSLELEHPHLALAAALFGKDGRSLRLAGAAMPPALLVHGNPRRVESFPLDGHPLGTAHCCASLARPGEGGPLGSPPEAAPGNAEPASAEHLLELAPGDLVVLATAGVAASSNLRGTAWGAERYQSLVAELTDLDPRGVGRSVAQAAHDWRRGQPAGRDLTLLATRVIG
ncbi:MAG: SpoIIE family protein phosphatase [Holophagales bacterium]|nr:SpoIIE family protein phosphatase [Holophagales bacterium]